MLCQVFVHVHRLTHAGQMLILTDMKSATRSTDDKRHPIQVVARRSGLSQDVLRAWEKRYGVVEPGRTDSGRRLYSDSDIERLALIRDAMAGGRRIGELARLSIEDLDRLVQEDRDAVPEPIRSEDPRAVEVHPDQYLAECLDAVLALDQTWLKAGLSRAAIALEPAAFIDEVATPLLHRIGTMWAEGRLTPGHEHMATTVIRSTLADISSALQPPNGAPRVLVATPAGQRHEIGAMLAAATAQLDGWHVTFLGGDLPAADIASAAEQLKTDVVALSLTRKADDSTVDGELEELRRLLPQTTLVIGGQAAPSYRHTLNSISAHLVSDLASLRATLRSIRA